MNILPFIHFFAFLVFCCLTVFVIHKDPKSLLNRVCTGLLGCLLIYNFSYIFIQNPDVSKDTAKLFNNIASIGVISCSSIFLWFSLIFTKKRNILKSKIIYFILFALPLLFIYKQWTGYMIVDFIKEYYGWRHIWSESVWSYLFFIYQSSLLFIGLYLIFVFQHKTEDPIRKKQGRIIFFSVFVSAISGLTTDIIFPKLEICIVPPLGQLFSLIWGFGLVYAIVKYKFLTLTPALAADEIISTMIDSLVLVDYDAKILAVNKATEELLGYKKEELINQPVGMILAEEEVLFKGTKLEKLIREGTIKDYDITYKTKSGEKIPVSFSGSVMRNKEEELIGIVGIARDMREIKKLITDLANTNARVSILISEVEEKNKALESANKELSEKTDTLERFHKVTVNRELEMIKLKEEINPLLEKSGKPKKYNV